MGKAGAHNGESGVKEAFNAKGHAALGTAAAATIVGGAALSGATLSAVTALSAAGHDQAKANDKQITRVEPAPVTLPAPATLLAPAPASASPAVKPGVPKPLAGDPAPVHAADPDSNSHPAPVVAPVPIVIEPPSRTEASTAAAPGDLPTLHPTGDPGPGSGPVAGDGGKGSVKAVDDLESHDRPRSASPAEPAATNNSEALARQGWVPIRHSGGEAVRDVQREVPGLEDDTALGTATGTTDPNAHADKEQSFDVESPPRGKSGEGADSDAARAGTRPARGEGKLETVLHRVEGPENFWDISRMYYSSGRYYKALWKANEDKVPEITKLHQGTVIRIPPPEDLDPAYVDPPGKRQARARAGRTPRSSPGTTVRLTIPPPRAQIRPPQTAGLATSLAMVCPSATPAGRTSS